MAQELGWDYERIGFVSMSFFLGYIVTQVLGGYLSDKFGAKLVLGYGLILWSIFTILTPMASYAGFTFLILARIGMGLGEGITFPAWHSLYARWVPLGERARSVGITNSGLFLGTVFANNYPYHCSSSWMALGILSFWICRFRMVLFLE